MQALLNSIANMALSDDAHRVFHGRGGCYPGSEQWTLDYFPPVWLLTSFQTASEDALEQVHLALARRLAQLAPNMSLNWVYQCRAEGQPLTQLMHGQVPEPHLVSERGTRYKVHLLQGQNHGLFLDMAEGRQWVRQWVGQISHGGLAPAAPPRIKVLNLFAYTCAFSVVALQAGARQVVNVDMSRGAMALGQQNHQLNKLRTGASFLVHDIFSTWGKITRSGPYDLVIVDPPSFQKGSFVASKDYARLMRRLPALVEQGGHVLLCLNAPELDTAFLTDLMRACAPTLQLVKRLPNPAAFCDAAPERSLKVLLYRAAD